MHKTQGLLACVSAEYTACTPTLAACSNFGNDNGNASTLAMPMACFNFGMHHPWQCINLGNVMHQPWHVSTLAGIKLGMHQPWHASALACINLAACVYAELTACAQAGGDEVLTAIGIIIGSDYNRGGLQGAGPEVVVEAMVLLVSRFAARTGRIDDVGFLAFLAVELAAPVDEAIASLVQCTGCKRCGHEGGNKALRKCHGKSTCAECAALGHEGAGCLERPGASEPVHTMKRSGVTSRPTKTWCTLSLRLLPCALLCPSLDVPFVGY